MGHVVQAVLEIVGVMLFVLIVVGAVFFHDELLTILGNFWAFIASWVTSKQF